MYQAKSNATEVVKFVSCSKNEAIIKAQTQINNLSFLEIVKQYIQKESIEIRNTRIMLKNKYPELLSLYECK
jgi:hypothetical protein